MRAPEQRSQAGCLTATATADRSPLHFVSNRATARDIGRVSIPWMLMCTWSATGGGFVTLRRGARAAQAAPPR